MGILILRILLLAATGSSGYFLEDSSLRSGFGILGAGIGLAIGLLFILFERSLKRMPLKEVIGGASAGAWFDAGECSHPGFFCRASRKPRNPHSAYIVINSALGYSG